MFGVDVQSILIHTKSFASIMVDNLEPTVKSMFITLCTIDLVLSMLYDESDGLNIFIKLFKKLFYYLFFWYIIINYKKLMFETLFKGFVQLGNLAGAGVPMKGIPVSTSLDWSVIDKIGFSVGKLAGAIITGIGFVALDIGWVESIPIVGLATICSFILFFVFLYVQIITIFIKFYFIVGFSYVLMPFAGFDKTKDIASKALNGVFSQGIEIFVTVVLINFLDFLDTKGLLTFGGAVKDDFFTRWVFTFFVYMLLTRAGTIASSLMSGAIASLGIGSGSMGQAGGNVTGAGKSWAGGYYQGTKMQKAFEPKARAMKGRAKGAYQKASNAIKNKLSNWN